MKRLLIVANRLPINVKETSEGLIFQSSVGGLATGLSSLTIDYETHWVGWPGIHPKESWQKEEITRKLKEDNIHPVFLTEKQIKLYYEGFSNKTIWPLFHYFGQYTQYVQDYWNVYYEVNRQICDEVVKVAQDGDIIWVQDYHLLLLPAMLREKLNNNQIGFFLHIPFPSYELFRTLPWRKELLNGILGADLIGFHTYDYMRHFMSAVYRLMGIEPRLGKLDIDHRVVQVDIFPMGIDYEKFAKAGECQVVQEEMQKFRQQFGNRKIIFSVDRLDYSKGIINRLKAFERFLGKYKQYRRKVSMVMILVPSRSGVDYYKELKVELNEMVGFINGKHATIDWTPIHYFYRSIPFEQLAALYKMADVGLVTPFRDGMNLVAKEYVASKSEKRGALILSEMAGAAIELTDALQVNPNDVPDIVAALHYAMKMKPAEQEDRMNRMQARVRKQTVHKWAKDFIRNLNELKVQQEKMEDYELTALNEKEILIAFSRATKRLIILDYDGTLVSFTDDPKRALPDDELKELLAGLSHLANTKTVIISGRDQETLGEWLGTYPIEMIAEHGAWFREGGKWSNGVELTAEWKEEIMPILQEFSDNTPGSFVEEKSYSVAWHYRRTDNYLAERRAQELINAVLNACSRLNLQILNGDKVVEIKVANVNKGTATKQWLDSDKWDFILAIGDDKTDEDIFRVLPSNAFSVKVGQKETLAKNYLKSVIEVRRLLKKLVAQEKELMRN